ncbi:acidic phospholipase A2 Cc1-PLA2-like [Diadema setosum]|uniref:acidic phospholipase A2 Cc1-PLA2-like n=1 Tax=Diadema setosum TaxID=31175 RepID=UPI003B3BAF39
MIVIGLSFVCIGATDLEKGLEHSRRKRSMYELGTMVACATGLSPMAYADYGCWCGRGGRGEAVDDIDGCCRSHDLCYQRLREQRICRRWQLYLQPYGFQKTCSHTDTPVLECTGRRRCAFELCQCDRTFALCVREHRESFNPEYKHYNQRSCL